MIQIINHKILHIQSLSFRQHHNYRLSLLPST